MLDQYIESLKGDKNFFIGEDIPEKNCGAQPLPMQKILMNASFYTMTQFSAVQKKVFYSRKLISHAKQITWINFKYA